MKKIKENKTISYRYVSVYVDDIESIYNIINHIAGNVKIQADGYEFDDLNEFLERHVPVNGMKSVKLSSDDPRFYVDIDENSVYVSTESDQDYFILKMEEWFRSSKFWFDDKKIFWCSGAILVLGILLILFADSIERYFLFEGGEKILSLSGAAIMPLSGCFLMLSSFFKKVSLVDSRKAQRTNLFKRNKDSIFVGVVSAVLGGVLLLILQKMFL